MRDSFGGPGEVRIGLALYAMMVQLVLLAVGFRFSHDTDSFIRSQLFFSILANLMVISLLSSLHISLSSNLKPSRDDVRDGEYSPPDFL